MTARRLAASLLFLSCSAAPDLPEAAPADESPPESVTRWSSQTELFMEYAALRVGRTSRFAIHLTDLATFEPLLEGRVTVELDNGAGPPERFVADGPSRPGIFGIDVTPALQGRPEMTIRIQSAALEDTHSLGPTSVIGSDSPVQADPPSESFADTEAVTYLKEQQWTLEFATGLVAMKSVRQGIRLPAIVEPTSGGQLAVHAPVSGRLAPSVRLPALGELIEAGRTLCVIAPTLPRQEDRTALQLAIHESELAIESAKRERVRMERLLAAGAVPARRLEAARARENLAMVRHSAAEERMALFESTRRGEIHGNPQNAFEVRSHIRGVVTALAIKNDARVKEGDVLLEISSADPVHVTGRVPESQAYLLTDVRGAEIEVPGSEAPVRAGKLVSKGLLVDPGTRTLGITFLAGNERRRLAIGQSLHLYLFTSASIEAPVAPTSAIVADGSRTVVYVQTAGESFERRTVTTGDRPGLETEITEGLEQGERIVTRGAYLLHLASLSTEAPAHGHVH